MGKNQSARKIRVLAASWRPDTVKEIETCLAGSRSDITLVGGAYDRNQAARRASELKSDVVLGEFGTPGIGGAETVKMLKASPVSNKVIAFAVGVDHAIALDVIKSGADGFLVGKDVKKGLVRAVKAVHADCVHIGSMAATTLLSELKTEARVPLIPENTPPLSMRETQIVAMVAEGLTNVQMAERLGISERTINVLREKLRKKLGQPSPAWLTRYAIERGLIKSGSK